MAAESPGRGAARALLSAERHGVLSTIHQRFPGWPFGSVTPYALTADGDPILLLSDIAEHSRNLRAEPRASLLVQDREALDRPLAGARVALMGRAAVPEGEGRRAALETYLARFPEAAGFSSAHGFDPWVLRVERVRWILGFGSMGWLEREDWATPRD